MAKITNEYIVLMENSIMPKINMNEIIMENLTMVK
jgi:hypothetical protein